MFDKILSFSSNNLIRNKSIQNFIFLGFIQASNILISLISMPLLIESIGVDQFGLVNLSLSVILLFNILVGFGYNLSGPREVAINQKNTEKLSRTISKIISSKLVLAGIATMIILIAAYGFNLFSEYRTILVFSVLLLFSEATLPLWFFQGLEKMKLISVANIFSKLLYLVGIVLFIHEPDQAKWTNFILGGTAFLVNLMIVVYIHYAMKISFFLPKILNILQSLKDNLLLFLSNLVSHISINGGLIVLSFFANAETLGMFSLAERITMVLRMLPSLIIQAIYPNASKLFETDKPSFFQFLKKAYTWALLFGLFLAVFTNLASPLIIKALARETLEDSISYLRILSFVPFLACLNIANVLGLLVKDKKRQIFHSSWLMCAFMLTVSIALTSIYGGIGLCYALVATEVFIFIISSFLIYFKNKDLFYGFKNSLFGSSHSG
ncbi:oligosaccharide flippase family protein [Cecembia rubra]|uniref:oligosaccharide flippase family protein n=1 Tax=Cecembia rubra TaxID=1485585 RepID=UPI0027154C3D|nr:oligosaccharide flippase family protein [Cecembia rubra]